MFDFEKKDQAARIIQAAWRRRRQQNYDPSLTPTHLNQPDLQDLTSWRKLSIDAHGALIPGVFVVPQNVALVFLTHPGDYCIYDYVTHMLSRDDGFLDDLILMRARRGGEKVFSVTYVPGDVCPDMRLAFELDYLVEGIFGVPYSRSFPKSMRSTTDEYGRPIPRNRRVLNSALYHQNNVRKNHETAKFNSNLFRQTDLPLSYVASNVIPRLSKGKPAVVFVSSCRDIDDYSFEVFEQARYLDTKILDRHHIIRTRSSVLPSKPKHKEGEKQQAWSEARGRRNSKFIGTETRKLKKPRISAL
jgi:hypothetical protein